MVHSERSGYDAIQSAAKLAVFGAVVADVEKAGSVTGTRPVFLKGVWADLVLYGGRGARLKGDVDVLVSGSTFLRFAKALRALGYEYVPRRTHRATVRWASKEWTLSKGALPCIDLHRGLADAPWFRWHAQEAIDSSQDYQVSNGRIRSLCPNDQILYAAAHYANHRYQLSRGHLNDMLVMLESFPVDWKAIRKSAAPKRLAGALWFLESALKKAGANGIPAWTNRGLRQILRTALAARWIDPGDLSRNADRAWLLDNLIRMPLPVLTGPITFMHHALGAGAFGALDRFFRTLPNMSWDKPDLD